jgi:hypothetical protein
MLIGAASFAADSTATIDASGIVTDELGKPIAGATVELIRRRYENHNTHFAGIEVIDSVKAQADGTFHLPARSLPVEKSEYFLRGVAPGRGYSAIAMALKGGLPAFSDPKRANSMKRPWIVLLPERTVRGIVVDERDEPIASCAVNVDNLTNPLITGADGRFTIEHFPDFGDSLLIDDVATWFVHPEFAPTVVPDSGRDEIDLVQPDGSWRVRLHRSVLVSGRALDESDSRPLSGIAVDAWCGGFMTTLCTDEAGRYKVRVNRGRMVELVPHAIAEAGNPNRDYARRNYYNMPKFDDNDDACEFDLIMIRGQSVAGQIKLPAGDDYRGKYISLRGDGGTELDGQYCNPLASLYSTRSCPGHIRSWSHISKATISAIRWRCR